MGKSSNTQVKKGLCAKQHFVMGQKSLNFSLNPCIQAQKFNSDHSCKLNEAAAGFHQRRRRFTTEELTRWAARFSKIASRKQDLRKLAIHNACRNAIAKELLSIQKERRERFNTLKPMFLFKLCSSFRQQETPEMAAPVEENGRHCNHQIEERPDTPLPSLAAAKRRCGCFSSDGSISKKFRSSQPATTQEKP